MPGIVARSAKCKTISSVCLSLSRLYYFLIFFHCFVFKKQRQQRRFRLLQNKRPWRPSQNHQNLDATKHVVETSARRLDQQVKLATKKKVRVSVTIFDHEKKNHPSLPPPFLLLWKTVSSREDLFTHTSLLERWGILSRRVCISIGVEGYCRLTAF